MGRRPSSAVFLSKELNDYLKDTYPASEFLRWIRDTEAVLKENVRR